VHAESDEARDAPMLRRSNEKQYAWVCLARLSRPLSGRAGRPFGGEVPSGSVNRGSVGITV